MDIVIYSRVLHVLSEWPNLTQHVKVSASHIYTPKTPAMQCNAVALCSLWNTLVIRLSRVGVMAEIINWLAIFASVDHPKTPFN